jgi:hypothetical protein
MTEANIHGAPLAHAVDAADFSLTPLICFTLKGYGYFIRVCNVSGKPAASLPHRRISNICL